MEQVLSFEQFLDHLYFELNQQTFAMLTASLLCPYFLASRRETHSSSVSAI